MSRQIMDAILDAVGTAGSKGRPLTDLSLHLGIDLAIVFMTARIMVREGKLSLARVPKADKKIEYRLFLANLVPNDAEPVNL